MWRWTTDNQPVQLTSLLVLRQSTGTQRTWLWSPHRRRSRHEHEAPWHRRPRPSAPGRPRHLVAPAAREPRRSSPTRRRRPQTRGPQRRRRSYGMCDRPKSADARCRRPTSRRKPATWTTRGSAGDGRVQGNWYSGALWTASRRTDAPGHDHHHHGRRLDLTVLGWTAVVASCRRPSRQRCTPCRHEKHHPVCPCNSPLSTTHTDKYLLWLNLYKCIHYSHIIYNLLKTKIR